MGIKLYMDQHVPRAITVGLRLRGVDVVTAYEDGASDTSDPELLNRAGDLGRVLFTQDDDLLAEASRRQREGGLFPGSDLRASAEYFHRQLHSGPGTNRKGC